MKYKINQFTGELDRVEGAPEGGTTSQVLVKSSADDYDVEWSSDLVVNSVQFTTTGEQGKVAWNSDEETLDLIQNGATLQVGQEIHIHVKNQTGSTITDGTVVMATGTLGTSGRITVAPMVADGSIEPKYLLGVATETIPDGEDGKVTTFGKVRGLDTSSFSEGAVLFCDPSVAGGFTATKPQAPNLKLPIAFVINSHANNGTIFIRIQTGTDLNENHHVEITSPTDGQALIYNSSLNRWENENISAGAGGADTQIQFNSSGAFDGSSNLVWDNGVTITSPSASNIPLILKGATSQTGNLVEWQNSSGVALSFVKSDGTISVPDSAYGIGWDGNTEVPTKNAIYDKIESLSLASGAPGGSNEEIQFNNSGVFGGSANLKLIGGNKFSVLNGAKTIISAGNETNPNRAEFYHAGGSGFFLDLYSIYNPNGNFTIRTKVAGTPINALSINTAGNATFSGTINASGLGATSGLLTLTDPVETSANLSVISGQKLKISQFTSSAVRTTEIYQDSTGFHIDLLSPYTGQGDFTIRTKVSNNPFTAMKIDLNGNAYFYNSLSANGLSSSTGTISTTSTLTTTQDINITNTKKLSVSSAAVGANNTAYLYCDSSGTTKLDINGIYSNNNFIIRTSTRGTPKTALTIAYNGIATASKTWYFNADSSSAVKAIFKASASQTANLTEWQDSTASVLSSIDKNGAFKPPSLADASAQNNSIYYSTDASKLVYKDSSGTVNNLY